MAHASSPKPSPPKLTICAVPRQIRWMRRKPSALAAVACRLPINVPGHPPRFKHVVGGNIRGDVLPHIHDRVGLLRLPTPRVCYSPRPETPIPQPYVLQVCLAAFHVSSERGPCVCTPPNRARSAPRRQRASPGPCLLHTEALQGLGPSPKSLKPHLLHSQVLRGSALKLYFP